MEITGQIMMLIAAMGIPSAFTGFCFWLVQRKINKQDRKAAQRAQEEEKKAKEQEDRRERYQLYLIKSVGAAIALGEATAKAVQRIPDAQCNGDMHAALEYATKVKHQQKDFLEQQAIEALQN